MKMSQIDRSNYYRGLLVLVGKDRTIDPRERELMLQLGAILDFEKRFCEAAIDDLLGNVYLTELPAVFSDREIAECFLRDAMRLALVDKDIHAQELDWLKAVAQANGLTDSWIEAEGQRAHKQEGSPDLPNFLDVQQYLGK